MLFSAAACACVAGLLAAAGFVAGCGNTSATGASQTTSEQTAASAPVSGEQTLPSSEVATTTGVSAPAELAVTNPAPAEGGWYEHTTFNLPDTGFAQLVVFSDPLHGWVIGTDFGSNPSQDEFSDTSLLLLATTDGGQRWTRQQAGTGASSPVSATFPDNQHGWVLDDSGTLWSTTDGGGHWSHQAFQGSLMWGGVDFLDTKRGWMVGAELQGETILPLILATTDGGATWIHQTTEPGTVPLQVCFADASHGWIVAESSTYENLGMERGPSVILSTSDGGSTWSRQLTTDGGLNAIGFTDATHGWAVGDGGAILATADGGHHWTRQAFTPGEPAPVSATTGADATPGTGTTTGSAATTGLSALYDFDAVSFSDPLHGWVASPTFIVGTSDGGAHWTTEYTQAPVSTEVACLCSPLSAVSCPDAGHVWALAGSSLLARSAAQ